MPEAPADAEPAWPFPPRYRWLKRLTAGSLLLTMVLTVVRFGWGWEARRRLSRELAPVLAAGEPVSVEGLTVAPVPDAENGASVYRRAIAAIGVESPSSSSMSYDDWFPFPPRWHKLEDRSIATNGAMLRAVREARAYGRFDWQQPQLKQPLFGYFPPHMQRAHHLSNVLGDAAMHAHAHGDDVEAIERFRDLRHFAAAIGAAPTLLGVHTYRVYSFDGGGLYRLQLVTPGLTIAPDNNAHDGPADAPPVPSTAEVRPAPRPATRAQVRALVGELLDEREQAESLRRAYATERAAQLDLADWLAAKAPLLRPMFQVDAVRVARANAALVSAAESTNLPAAKRVLRAEPLLALTQQTTMWKSVGTAARVRPVDEHAVDYTSFLTTDLCNPPRVTFALDEDFRTRAARRLSAASLAVRLYRADHAGAFPPSLDALVPTYLPAVPSDPYRADGGPIGYVIFRGALPGGGDRPLVYSVASDGGDDTAARGLEAAGLPPYPCHSGERGPDIRVDVSRWVPVRTNEQEQAEAAQEEATRLYDEQGRPR